MKKGYFNRTNLIYIYNTIKNNNLKLKRKTLTEINLLGQQFFIGEEDDENVITEKNFQIINLLNELVNFTYIKKFNNSLLEEFEEVFKPDNINFQSDAGWGCMIRVGQMFLFKILIEIAKYKKLYNDNTKKEIISLFLEPKDNTEFNIYSIHNIVKETYKLFKYEPGTFYRPTTISFIIEKLVELYNKDFLYINYPHGIIYLNELYNKINGIKLETENNNITIDSFVDDCNFNKPILISITCNLGVNYIEDNYIDYFKQIIKNDSFIGILGGYKNKAYYILGYNNINQIYYLDPHYIENLNNEHNYDKETVFKVFTMSLNKISPGFNINYLLKNKTELSNFLKFFKSNNQVISIESTNNYEDIDEFN